MTAQALFFNAFSEKDRHLNAVKGCNFLNLSIKRPKTN